MEGDNILEVLSTPSPNEKPQTRDLRETAHSLISATSGSDTDSLPATLLDLLTQIVKPLFSNTKHAALTSTGRKNLVSAAPSLGNRFNHPLTDDELKPWKTPFTAPLLRYIITSHSSIVPTDRRKQTVGAHFHLLIPPLLNMIDDGSSSTKAAGCQLLRLLCELLISVGSDMLHKTGLGDVFFDALKTNFMLLPTLTPEDESLEVLRQLYPAFLATVDARYRRSPTTTIAKEVGKPEESNEQIPASKEFTGRQDRLKLLLRHGVLASLSHLSSGQSFSSSTSVPLTTYLVSQIAPIIENMGIDSVRYLREFLPVLRAGLMDPFALVAKDLVAEILLVLDVLLDVCEVRVRELWWPEILRGLVGCWVNCVDEGVDKEVPGGAGVEDIQRKLKQVTVKLGSVVEKEQWLAAKERLLGEEEDLVGLFEGS
ncbi:uncharacterized protein A1O9_08205 [Exophiala aquamarina CBS 119918]|uniref:Uncharacterized protein n=1 Tax=Exophiala aquamarina CBS 119918 TaxID=1182545 RepID=A0A072PIU9_9EURO|nr:uncharacterized protein A1O9_08205 [Exophiala aquamarina CBS 119918]KEF55455.1 hypothetical protein A1O9_08205 [Exophiala aquamarina CBS 119918]